MKSGDALRDLFKIFRPIGVSFAIAIATPVMLLKVTKARFGGWSPLTGVPPLSRWNGRDFASRFTDRLTETAIADLVIRVSLTVVWIVVLATVVIVVAEIVHMSRHGGLPMPEIRGLRLTQRGALAIAIGLLAIAASASPPTRSATEATTLVAQARLRQPSVERVHQVPTHRRLVEVSDTGSNEYVVRQGESIYGIAAKTVGPNSDAIRSYAELLLEANLGRKMIDGRTFNNVALVEPGWVLNLPTFDSTDPLVPSAPPNTDENISTTGTHIVEQGESLSSIARQELGDPTRWPEIMKFNEGRIFPDGRSLSDPNVILPGWSLALPASSSPIPDAEIHPLGLATNSVSDAPEAPEQDWVNVWIEPIPATDRAVPGSLPPRAAVETPSAWRVVNLESAAMLASGVLALLAVRRRTRLRNAPAHSRIPEPLTRTSLLERRLVAVSCRNRSNRAEAAIGAVAAALVDHGVRVSAILSASDGALELLATGPATLPRPWKCSDSIAHEASWRLAPSAFLDDKVGAAPCPALVQLGRTIDGLDVLVDLEAIAVLEVGGTPTESDAIIAAISATLAGSVNAEVATLVGVGVRDEVFFGHRGYSAAENPAAAIDFAVSMAGSIQLGTQSTFELRCGTDGGINWEPVVVLIGSNSGSVAPPSNMAGLAIVSASPVVGACSRLVPDGDSWELRPLGLRFHPVGLAPVEVTLIGELVRSADEPCLPQLDEDETIVPEDDHLHVPQMVADSKWPVLVRLLGPISVVRPDGLAADFERSKAKELIVWLATHRQRSTRSAARAALWEMDVRDATFSNVVSDARRALSGIAEPPTGTEWLGRTLTDALPLHPIIRTDADLLADAVVAARAQEPTVAIATLSSALDWVVGLPFEGTSYLWSDAEGIASNLVLLATSAASDLANRCLAVGDVDGVFRATGRGLAVLPGHEELIGLRMRAHACAGDHAGVRREWQIYERVVSADPWSSGEPSPKLADLRRELLSSSR